MLCNQCGETTEADILPLACPFCHTPFEVKSGVNKTLKPGKISQIPRAPVTVAQTPEEKFQELFSEAEEGDIDAIFSLGTAYFYGEGVEKNLELAFHYFKKAAELGDLDGIFQTGLAYFQGLGVAADAEQAYLYFKKAASENHPKGNIMLGIYYTSEKSAHFSPEEGVRLLEKGAIHEADCASVALAICYSQGIGVEKDHKKALHWLSVGIQHKNEVAMYHMASWYIKGDIVPSDFSKAIPLLEESCELHCAESHYLLAQCYFCGSGVLENWSSAIRHIRQGDTILQRHTPFIDQIDFYVHPPFLPAFGIPELENLVESGTSIYIHYALGLQYEKLDQNDKALAVFEHCARENLPQAIYKLGEHYENLSSSQASKAIEFYEKATKFHYAPAFCALGRFYEDGIYLQKNDQFAYFCYQTCAHQQYGLGTFHLALCYQKGIFVPIHLEKAREYFKLSLEQGYYPAKDFLS